MSLAARLTKYLEGQPGWVSSGDLQKLTIEKAGQTGRTAVRRLEELTADGVLEVQYRAKNHAWYRYKRSTKEPDVFTIAGMWQEKSPWTGEVTGVYHEIYEPAN